MIDFIFIMYINKYHLGDNDIYWEGFEIIVNCLIRENNDRSSNESEDTNANENMNIDENEGKNHNEGQRQNKAENNGVSMTFIILHSEV